MKIDAHIEDIHVLDDTEPCVGGLVVSKVDPNSRGLIVELVARNIVSVLWSVPPQNTLGVDHRDIW